MKKLLIIITISISNLSFSQNYFKLSDTIGQIGPKKQLNIFTAEWTVINNGDTFRDSIKREFLQKSAVDKLNSIRKSLGMKELIYDERLKPAAIHNAIYNRYCQNYNIFQPGEEKQHRYTYTLTHTQRVDIPNFKEILWPDQRISLLDQTTFSNITEELMQRYYMPSDTYAYAAENVWNTFKLCDGHWSSLTKETNWDCVYFYYDTTNGVHVIILGNYKL